MDGVFEVIFEGRIMPNRNLDEVKAALALMFKASPEAIERLFSGKLIPIKRDLDYPSALRYVSAMKEAGALARLRQIEGAVAVTAPAQGSSSWTVAPPGTVLVERQLSAAPDVIRVDHLSLAPVGATVGEPREIEPVVVGDLSEFSLAETGADIGDPVEHIPLPEPDISALSMAEVGATIGEARHVEPVKVGDLSAISLAPVGATMSTTPKAPPPPPPKTDHLSLSEDKK